jgi:hypothetical protein
MPKRFLVITVLATALPFSQGGSFLIAALCPHLRSGTPSCEAQPSPARMSHEDMSHEHMGHGGHLEMEHGRVSIGDPNAIALGQPIGTCSHCTVHSRTTANTAYLREREPAKPKVDIHIPHQSRVSPVMIFPLTMLTPRAHGPPGELTPRHILISIFRI